MSKCPICFDDPAGRRQPCAATRSVDLAADAAQALQGVTPGPWKAAYSKWESNNFIVQTDHPCRRVLAQFDGDGDGPDDQSLADARFIAFARAWVPEAAAALTALSAERDALAAQVAELTAYLPADYIRHS